MFSDLLRMIGTRADQIDWLFEIDTLVKNIFIQDKSLQQSSDIAANLHKFLEKTVSASDDLISKKDVLNKLSAEILQMRVVEIRIAVTLDKKSQDEVVLWIKNQVSDQCLVEFIYVPGLISGATISYKGNYVDLSFKTKFLDFFSKQSNWIREYFDL